MNIGAIHTINNVKVKQIKELEERTRVIDEITGETFYPNSDAEAFNFFEKLSKQTNHAMSLFMPAKIISIEKKR